MAELRVEARTPIVADSQEVLKSKERLQRQWGAPVTQEKVKEASKKIAESLDRRKADDSDRVWVRGEVVEPSKAIDSMRRQLLGNHRLPLGQEKA